MGLCDPSSYVKKDHVYSSQAEHLQLYVIPLAHTFLLLDGNVIHKFIAFTPEFCLVWHSNILWNWLYM